MLRDCFQEIARFQLAMSGFQAHAGPSGAWRGNRELQKGSDFSSHSMIGKRALLQISEFGAQNRVEHETDF